MKLAPKSLNHGTVEVHTGHGELVQCDIMQRTKLMKHDRFIDHSTLPILESLTAAEFKILMIIWRLSAKNGFVADKAIETDITRQTKALSLKTLCSKDLVRKAVLAKGVRTFVKGWLINPVHFRKTRQTEEYFQMLEVYNSYQQEETLLMANREYDQILQERTEVENQLKEK